MASDRKRGVNKRFPITNTGEAFDLMLASLGASRAPKLTECTICGHRMWGGAQRAHTTCLVASGQVASVHTPGAPVSLPSAMINPRVYDQLAADPDASHVSPERSERAYNEATARHLRGRRCTICGRPLTLGQRGTHLACRTPQDPRPAGPAQLGTAPHA